MNLKRHIPNIITLANLFCGCIALVKVTHLEYELAFYWLCLGVFFDFFDGFFARLLKVSGPLGLQLDSLADMVTNGVVPGYVMFMLLQHNQHNMLDIPELSYFGFIVTLGACYRLAKFNIDTRQTDSFIGLPTPSMALFILSLPLIQTANYSVMVSEFLSNQIVLLGICSFAFYIMNAEIHLFSLKVKSFTLKDNILQIGFLTFSLATVIGLQFLALPIIIISYVLISIIKNIISK